ncbi:MAG: Gfo/Idh/MocA family protein, partial [Planctomycetota bacterium]
RNGNLAKDYAHRHHVKKWYDDAQKLIEDPEVNAVYIATPPSSHKEYTLAVASAGKPVYVEKPMALNHNECQEMITMFLCLWPITEGHYLDLSRLSLYSRKER